MHPPALDNLNSLTSFLPEFSLIAGVLLVVFWDLFARGKTRVIGVVTITLAALASSCVTSIAYLAEDVPGVKLFYGLLAFDAYAHLFRIIFACVAAVIVVFAVPEPETGAGTERRDGVGEFFALLLVIALGLNLMAMSRNLLMIYLSIELVSVISFVLAGFKQGDRRSSEAALKYVVFGGMSSGIMVYGMSWLYGFSRSLDLASIAQRITEATASEGHIPLAVLVGVICVLAGFCFKISAAPFHLWAPDVYEGAPTSITALLSVAPKAGGFAVLIRFFSEALHATSESGGEITPWAFIGGMIAIATMFVGNLSALHQTNVKRMLAYSSIAHAGYMLLGFCVFNESGARAIIFYIVVYAFMNLGAFLVVSAVASRHGGNESIDTYRGLKSRAPVLAVLMAIFLFSLTGLPPFAGFLGKFLLFAALVEAGGGWNWTLAVVGVINSVISLFYYARVLRAMFLTESEVKTPLNTHASWTTTAVALALPTALLIVYWEPIYTIVSSSVTGH